MSHVELRDFFAAHALPLAMAEYRMVINRTETPLEIEWNKHFGLSCVAADAYELADAMIEAREGRDGKKAPEADNDLLNWF